MERVGVTGGEERLDEISKRENEVPFTLRKRENSAYCMGSAQNEEKFGQGRETWQLKRTAKSCGRRKEPQLPLE